MRKFLALLNIIAWGSFWAFGYLALTAENFSDTQVLIAMILSCIGFAVGMFTYRYCAKSSEASGYAIARSLDPLTRERAQARHPL